MKAGRLMAPGHLAITEVERDPSPAPTRSRCVSRRPGSAAPTAISCAANSPASPPSPSAMNSLAPSWRRGAVVCDPNIACGACLRGRVNLCAANVAIGIGRDGGFAEYACIPGHRALPLPAGLSFEAGALAEPLACTLHGLDIARLVPGERALILGGGVTGRLAVPLARAAGAEIMRLTRQSAKRAVAAGLGAHHTAATPAEARALWPAGADAVLECTGVAETMEAAPSLATAGGRVVILGVLAQGRRIAIEPFDLLFREVALLPAFLNPFTQSRALDLLARGTVVTAALITRRLAHDDLPAAPASPPPPGDIKTLILP